MPPLVDTLVFLTPRSLFETVLAQASFIQLTKVSVQAARLGTGSQRIGVRGWRNGTERKRIQGSSIDLTPTVGKWPLILLGLWKEPYDICLLTD